ncbi:MAG: YifB family Mg chelatase-like AAA ATPase, partial [Planctomycetaceae bacterium]|nr:YifB family Mg chelatase-like AAA ATPase [Planctomycetaceae bacterium]
MLAKLYSIAITGVDAVPVEVELDHNFGVPYEVIVGLPDKAVKEALSRIKSALRNNGYDFPSSRRLIYSLAPAELKKEGAVYDLPLALVSLMASEQLAIRRAGKYLVLGELSLGGECRPVRGALAAAITARQLGMDGVVLPRANAAEAAAVEGVHAVGVASITEAVGFFAAEWEPPTSYDGGAPEPDHPLCYSDMRGQESLKRAMLVAASGGHHCLLMGPPGSGKTMAAQRLPSILPPLTPAESLEATKIHSVAGEIPPGRGLLRTRPFRSPHHNASLPGLIGGGTTIRPGEISLAHNGVLFMDEAPEFPRQMLETLRQPLEDGVITISRAVGAETFPARVQLILSMNLCPCGRRGDPKRACRCSEKQILAYTGKLSGPLLDRIDLHVEVPPVDHERLMSKRLGETSSSIRERVLAAREVQSHRFPGSSSPINAAMTPKQVEEFCRLDTECEGLLRAALTEYNLSARAYGRVLMLARTIADLDRAGSIWAEHLLEAIQY